MLNKVYTAVTIDDGLFEAKRDFPEAITVYCSELTFEEFCLAHQYSLFDSTSLKLFVGVDSFPSEKLVYLLKEVIEIPACWIFKSLDKRTRLYKSLKALVSIEDLPLLNNKRDKKKFVTQQLKSLKIPSKHSKHIMQVSADSRSSIYRELLKFSTALKVLPENEAMKTLSMYKADTHTLDFISMFLSGEELVAMKSVHLVSHVPAPVMSATLLKRLLSLIYLSKGNTEYAKMFWDRNGYYLSKDSQLARRLGTAKLVNTYLYVDTVFNDFLRKEPQHLRLLKLIRFFRS